MARRWALVGLVVLVTVSVAAAQPPGPPGGFGRPGFAPPKVMPGSAAMLLGIPEVRKELSTSDTQNKQIDELLPDLQEKMRAAFGSLNFQELQGLSQEERDKRMEEVRKKSEEAAKKGDDQL